jgi:peptidoglycan hydrolase-like protein with peptidoglycan-binding domain
LFRTSASELREIGEPPERVEMARTNPPSSPMPQITPSATDSPDLPRTLQRELKRVGCLYGEADGVWGEQSRAALKSFVRHASVNIAGDEPSNAALDATLAKQSRVCPIVCDSDEKLVGERCVAVPKPPRPAVKEQVRREQPRRAERPAAEPSEPRGNSNSGKRICFGARPNELVTCP